MSASTADLLAARFLVRALRRDGAEVEEQGEARLFAVVPPALCGPLSLPEAALLSLEATGASGETPFPLEGPGMQWCVERAQARGRRAGASLGTRCGNAVERAEEVRRRLVFDNATAPHANAVVRRTAVALFEFAYEARSEERADGRVAVAVPAGDGAPSFALADALLGSLDAAEPEDPALGAEELSGRARRAVPAVEREVRRRLDGFRRACAGRLQVEGERIVEYHERLVREARLRRPRAGAGDVETLDAKREAILRQRDRRLAELAERHAVDAAYRLESVVVLRYDAVACEVVVRRRRRELALDLLWDPVLRAPLAPACAACGEPGFVLHACDEAGHLTCAACAARCGSCARVVCRACRPAGCGCAPGAGVTPRG